MNKKCNKIMGNIKTLTKDGMTGLKMVKEWLSAPPKQKAQTNLGYLVHVNKLAMVYGAFIFAGIILILTVLAGAA